MSGIPRWSRTAPCARGAEVAELTGAVDLDGYSGGTRILVWRERPRPGAQLSLFDLDEGMHHQVFLTDTPDGEGSLQHLDVRHRAHARVEDRIRGKTTGFGRLPSPPLPDQRRLARTGSDRRRSARLDSNTVAESRSRPSLSRRSSATGCCTQPPASSASAATSTCESPRPGPGDTS